MTTLDDLRDTFDAYAGNGLDVDQTLATAQAGATRIRRRRRTVAACVAAAVLAVVAVTPVAVARLRTDGAAPQPAATPSYRKSSQLTVSLAAGTPYFVMSQGTDGHQQDLIVRRLTPLDGSGGSIFVHDPGSYDGTAFAHGSKAVVSGHPVTVVDDLLFDPAYLPQERSPAVGWQDASGAWVVVTQTKTVAAALELAADVRLAAPRAVIGPVGFDRVPGDLPLAFSNVEVAVKAPAGQTYSSSVGFGPGRAVPRSMPIITDDPGLPVTVMVQPVSGRGWAEVQGAAGATEKTINGFEARFVTDKGSKVFVSGPGGHVLIKAGTCGIEIHLRDLAKAPFARAEQMIKGMTVRDCTDLATWGPVQP